MNFDELQQQIYTFCSEQRALIQNHPIKSGLFTSDALFCAEDAPRNRLFWQAIRTAQQNLVPNYHTIDAGAGIGLLGIMALLNGSQYVTFIESNYETYLLCKKFIQKCNIPSSQYELIKADATKIKLTKTYDLLISETISRDLKDEDFVRIIPHLKPSLQTKGIIIPAGFQIDDKYVRSETINIEQNNYTKKRSINLYDQIWIHPGDCMSLGN